MPHNVIVTGGDEEFAESALSHLLVGLQAFGFTDRVEEMLIELWSKQVATDYPMTVCAICGNNFELGSVYSMVAGDQGQELAEMCPVCLDYLNRRKADVEDPTPGNWPDRDWPTAENLEDARRRYPEPMFETYDDLATAAVDGDEDYRIYRESVVWRMEPERMVNS